MSTPQAPDPLPEEIWSGTPNVVLDGETFAIGWQRFPGEQGGPAYMTVRRSLLGGWRVIGRYPLTSDGWARAWAELSRLDPDTAHKNREALGRREAQAAIFAAARSTLAGLVLSVVDPPSPAFAVGQSYDLRLGEDGLRISRSGSQEAQAEYHYADVAAVQVTGFEQVPIGSRVEIALEQFLDHTTALETRTCLRVQTVDLILDFWYTAVFPAEDIRQWLEPANRAIREAWLSAAADKRTDWLVSELSRLADRLDHGTLTRTDFEFLRARIAGGY